MNAIDFIRAKLTSISANLTDDPRGSATDALAAFDALNYFRKRLGRGGVDKYVVESRTDPGMLIIFTKDQPLPGVFGTNQMDEIEVEIKRLRDELAEDERSMAAQARIAEGYVWPQKKT